MAEDGKLMDIEQYRARKKKSFDEYQKTMPCGEDIDEIFDRVYGNDKFTVSSSVDLMKYSRGGQKRLAASKEK